MTSNDYFSVFNEQWELLMSNWVVYTDKALEELIDLLYQGLIKTYKYWKHSSRCSFGNSRS